MARLTEIQDESGSESEVQMPRSSAPASLTQAQREQVLFESGVLEKLGLPKDFITLEQAQAQLEAQRTAETPPSAVVRAEENARRLAKHAKATRTEKAELDSDEDGYGSTSDVDYEQEDDTAERLLREQEANEMSPRLESVLDLLIWTMPFGFLYTLLDVLVRQQYGETVGFIDEAKRLGGSLPGKAVQLQKYWLSLYCD